MPHQPVKTRDELLTDFTDLADEIDARAREHACAGWDCAICGPSMASARLRELVDELREIFKVG